MCVCVRTARDGVWKGKEMLMISYPAWLMTDGAFDNRGVVVRQSRCFVQEQPPGVVVVSTFVAGINPRGCRGCHLDCQAILAKSTPSDTTPLGSSRYWCVI